MSWSKEGLLSDDYGLMIKDPDMSIFYKPNISTKKIRYQQLMDTPRDDCKSKYNGNKKKYERLYESDPPLKIPAKQIISCTHDHRTNEYILVYDDTTGLILAIRVSSAYFISNYHNRSDVEILSRKGALGRIINRQPFSEILNEDIRKAKKKVAKKVEEVITWTEDDFVKPISTYYYKKTRPFMKRIFGIQ